MQQKLVKNIIISGGNFINKGAEAMLFVTVVECIERFPGCTCMLQFSEGFYKIESIKELYDISKKYGRKQRVSTKNGKLAKLCSMLSIYRKADLMVDISGYELSSKLGVYPSMRYIFKIALSKWMKTDVVLLPQSFGPFDYKGGLGKVVTLLIKNYLKYPILCFARENKSSNYLREVAPTAHIKRSVDLVIQNSKISKEGESFVTRKDINSIVPGSVGLVVNRRLYEQYGEEFILSRYESMIQKTISCGRNVYLLCHASDDFDICERLKQIFDSETRVHLYPHVLSSFDFQFMAKGFDYVIAARYHSIVHSYKEFTPCVAIGWADKYQELLEAMGQGQYIVNMGSDNINKIMKILEKMEISFQKESSVIKKQLHEVQKSSCFDEMQLVFGTIKS